MRIVAWQESRATADRASWPFHAADKRSHTRVDFQYSDPQSLAAFRRRAAECSTSLPAAVRLASRLFHAGHRFCQFVDTDAEARAVIRRNAEALGVTGICKIWRRDSTQLGRCVPQAPFDLVFVDPPYNKDLGSAALASLVDGRWLGPHAMIVLEESAQSILVIPPQLQLVDAREYGDTKVIFCTADRDWNGGWTIPSE